MPYFARDLAVVHAKGFGKHADRCAPGILELLAPVRGGVILELGCGSGALTAYLLAAGHRVIATDASPAMVELARATLGPDADVRRLTLPDDPLPAADALVSVGHAISYLPAAAAVDRALVAMADALRPGGVLAIDICDLSFGEFRATDDSVARVGPDWAVLTRFSVPAPEVFIRDITTFVPDGHGAWRRDDERHENVLVDTSGIPALLAGHGVTATLGTAFGAAELPPGLIAVTGRR
jgi:SAM-dependent methyltransferase